MASNAERLALLFRGSERGHGTYGSPEKETKPTGQKWSIRTSAKTVHSPPTIELFEKHLEGTYPLGIIPITEQGSCYWGGIDVDDYSINPLILIHRIEQGKFPLIPVQSKSSGLHLFMFMEEEQPATLVQGVLNHLAAKLGLANCEIFPKQTRVLAEKGDMGNWLCIPMLGTTFGGKLSEQAAIKKTGAKLTLEEFLNHAEASQVTLEELQKWESETEKRKPSRSLTTSGPKKEPDEPFSDGPPCLGHLAMQGVPDGGRNSTLFMMALYYIKVDDSTWKTRIEEANRLFFNPPLGSEEVLNVIKSVERKAPKEDEDTGYKYTCKTSPMAQHCNSKLCRGRRFGVGSADEVPKLTGIAKLNTEPPIWFINVGDMRIEANTDQLQNYYKFHLLCLEKGNICYRAMKQQDWLTVLGDALQHEVTILEVSPEVSLFGQFKELLEEYLTDRQVADDKEELARGLPWKDVENGSIYFKLSPFQNFLEKQNFKSFKRAQIVQRIRDMGGEHKFFTLKGNKGHNCWGLPMTSLSGDPTTYSLPPIKKSPI